MVSLSIVGLLISLSASNANCDSPSDLANALHADTAKSATALSSQWAQWLDSEGKKHWGSDPELCDDLLFARRLYLDLLGRVPSVAELRDYLELAPEARRSCLIESLVFWDLAMDEKDRRKEDYQRAFAEHWARQWRRIMLPPSSFINASELESWLFSSFSKDASFQSMMGALVEMRDEDRAYFRISQSSPATYAANLSRVMLGVRLECAQCHDHPFTEWKQSDFWGLAAFYSDLSGAGNSKPEKSAGAIENDGVIYKAKLLWDEPLEGGAARAKLASWITSPSNKMFASVAVNRFWQLLVGRGVFADVDDFDIATPEQRVLIDQLAAKFAQERYPIRTLIAAICKSRWYQSATSEKEAGSSGFYRPVKSLTPEQVFDSLEQSLLLPISRLDPSAARWTGQRVQLLSRLGETNGKTPEDFEGGIPQALVMMNGRLIAEAIALDSSRLLRATVDSPFLSSKERIETLCLATLSRYPTADEQRTFAEFIASHASDEERRKAHGEVLWALVNSPEFVLCR